MSANNTIRRSDKKADAGVCNSIYALMPEQSAIQVLFLEDFCQRGSWRRNEKTACRAASS